MEKACRFLIPISPKGTDDSAIVLQHHGNSIATRQPTSESYNGHQNLISVKNNFENLFIPIGSSIAAYQVEMRIVMEMCLVIKMQGQDYRQVTGQASNEAAVRGAPPSPLGGR